VRRHAPLARRARFSSDELETKIGDDVSNNAGPIGVGTTDVQHWRLYLLGQEHILVLQFPAAAPGRLQISKIDSIDPQVPKLYTRLGSSYRIQRPPATDALFMTNAAELLQRRYPTSVLQDESDAIYERWRAEFD
jgi:hypothetical protein